MASTYENDLRLEEMATGENSGSWGTKTNTNLELIADAFGYGTEAITTNADTHTTTIADGASDAGRAIYLKYTGALDSACTITIGPNTVSKMWFIENATSGSQNIIISQGSGANITIGAGKTKIVYSDGAGAGAGFVEATDGISINSLFVDDNLLVGYDTSVNFAGEAHELQVSDTNFSVASFATYRDGSDGATLSLGHSRNSTLGSQTVVNDNDLLGSIQFHGSDGTDFAPGARIFARVNGTPGNNDMPSELVFSTSADGSDSPTERLVIDSGGNIAIGTSTTNVYSGYTSLTLDNATNGGIIDIERGGNLIGEIFSFASSTFALSAVGERAINFSTNSLERFRIDSSGNIGIGTSSPTVLLDLESASPIIRLTDSDASGTPECQISGAGGDLIFDADRDNEKASSVMSFKVDGSEVMRLAGSGLSIGSSDDNPFSWGGSSNNVSITASGANDWAQLSLKGNGTGATGINLGAGSVRQAGIFSSPDSHLDFATNPTNSGTGLTTRMRIDSSGALVLNNAGGDAQMYFGGTSGTNRMYLARSGSDSLLWNASNGAMRFGANNTERCRIDTDGNFLVGKQSISNDAGCTLYDHGQAYFVTGAGEATLLVNNSGGSNSTNTLIQFYRNSIGIGTVTTSGTSTYYNTSSDYRLKTDVQPMVGASARVQALNPVNFEWISDGTRVDGFLAHEAQAVVPECVTGTKDAMKDEEYEISAATGEIYTPLEAAYVDEDGEEVAPTNEVIHSTDVVKPETLEDGQLWRQTTEAVMGTRSVIDPQGIDQAKLVPLLTAALQEALTKIDSLETRLTALEGA